MSDLVESRGRWWVMFERRGTVTIEVIGLPFDAAESRASMADLLRQAQSGNYRGGPYQQAARAGRHVDVLWVAKAFEAARLSLEPATVRRIGFVGREPVGVNAEGRIVLMQTTSEAATALLRPEYRYLSPPATPPPPMPEPLPMGLDHIGFDGYPRVDDRSAVTLASLSAAARARLEAVARRFAADLRTSLAERARNSPPAAPPPDDGTWLVTPADLRETRHGKGLGSTGPVFDFEEE